MEVGLLEWFWVAIVVDGSAGERAFSEFSGVSVDFVIFEEAS